MSDQAGKSFLSEFKITDRASCERAIRNGGIAALVSAGMTAVFAAIGLFWQPPDAATTSSFFDPWMLVDVVFVLVLASLVFRKSRVAATLLCVYFISGKISQWLALGEPRGLFLAVVFIAYYVTAMRATYAWHSTYRHQVTSIAEGEIGSRAR